ncbi:MULTISPECIES: hypothetical protein [Flavobacterium]|uniref:Uncharacterized protein n=2 Tax=Flavobacterium TaxID=237 RepID=A0A940XB63_9FLAO|nr:MULTISPECIES: hypothetical protein [Flavobacterium]MBP4138786.1 hypothetical protein [Flavobacterium geliluteum]MDX6182549.1 hypothetical protein [Flavobacterium sp. Fl-33]MDX6185538.1 hypothetical protein [Flavobacterium sp. Fl-77]UFH38728.1 hypothetical protein LNP22_00250 [Flavobacterium sp. F-70]
MAENYEFEDQNTQISLADAQEWVKKWKDTSGEADIKKKVNSYLIPKVNLEKVLAQDIDAARAYIGINNKGEQTIMIVGTKRDPETGIYVDLIPGYGTAQKMAQTDSGIYDFSQPSPPEVGDVNSPMNQ